MPINAGYEYFNAEKEYLNAQTLTEKIYWLEEMIKKAPKHKSSENFVAELKQRLKKLQEKSEKASKKKGGNKGIRKEGFQFVLIGKTNSGKSFLLSRITHATPRIAEHGYTTIAPEVGTFEFEGVRAQVVDIPALGSDNFDIGIVNTADCLIIVVEGIEEVEEIGRMLARARGKKIFVFNKSDLLDKDGLRKLEAKIKSKKINGIVVSALTDTGIDLLKRKMFSEMDVVRVFMKEPGKKSSSIPAILSSGSTIKDVAETIYKGFSAKIAETRLTGPSSKFPNQKVGLNHVVKDLDIVEFHTK